MAIRMSGLVSNMDTDAIVKQLMEAQRTKVTKIENRKTKLEWSQDKWKSIQTKLYALYQDQTSNLRLQGSYGTRKATSADESVVKVTANSNATAGSYSIAVAQLASTQYVTGAKLGSNVTGSTKLSSLGILSGTKIDIKKDSATTATTLNVTDSTTLNDFLSSCKDAGISASYDATQKRLFISSSSSGQDQTFSITTNTASTTISGISSSDQTAAKSAMDYLMTNKAVYDGVADKNTFIANAVSGNTSGMTADQAQFANNYKTLYDLTKSYTQSNATAPAAMEANQVVRDAITQAVYSASATTSVTASDGTVYNIAGITSMVDIETSVDSTLTNYYANTLADPEKTQLDDITTAAKAQLDAQAGTSLDYTDPTNQTKLRDNVRARYLSDKLSTEIDNLMATSDATTAVNGYTSSEINDAVNTAATNLRTNMESYLATGGTALDGLGIGNVNSAGSSCAGSSFVKANDCKVIYNGAELTSSTNKITVNGLTFEAIGLSEKLTSSPDTYKTTSTTVTKDTDATYKMVKDFLTKYNDILKTMNDAYYADSARGYDPLTDDEKEAMTDDQITKWEDKIKSSLLRRDTTLGGIISSMKQSMSSSVEINGKNYSLSTYGIMTSTDYSEKGLLHIYGDSEDATYKEKDDKLKKALEEDPETVVQALSGIVDNLHKTLVKKMEKTSLSSALTFYNDKDIKDRIDDYKDDISKMEDKLQDMEDRYYKQFTAMEKAMASLQSQQSALAGLLGTN